MHPAVAKSLLSITKHLCGVLGWCFTWKWTIFRRACKETVFHQCACVHDPWEFWHRRSSSHTPRIFQVFLQYELSCELAKHCYSANNVHRIVTSVLEGCKNSAKVVGAFLCEVVQLIEHAPPQRAGWIRFQVSGAHHTCFQTQLLYPCVLARKRERMQE